MFLGCFQQLIQHGLLVSTLLCSSVALFSCAQECPQSTPCRTCEVCDLSNVPLSRLDVDARERLKNEVLTEVRDDLRAQWKREFMEEMAKAHPDQKAGVEKQTEVAAEQAEPQRQHRRSRPSVEFHSAQPIEKDERGLKVVRQALATGIVRRLPVDERDSFTIEDASIFCFAELSSNDENERYVTLKFIHSTGLSQSYELAVGQSPAWRTWSKLNLTQSMTGAWLCEVYNEDGVLLASKPFTVE